MKNYQFAFIGGLLFLILSKVDNSYFYSGVWGMFSIIDNILGVYFLLKCRN